VLGKPLLRRFQATLVTHALRLPSVVKEGGGTSHE
jgi:hypothetical protein